MDEMYFYHSFPRGNDINSQIENGLKRLGSMVKHGLLLTPKELGWAKKLGFPDVKFIIKQKRICFTFIRPSELDGHIKKWGIFSIEFDKELLRLGAMPMFYVPTSHKPEASPPHLLILNLWNALNELKNKPSIRFGLKALFGLLYPTEYKLEDTKFDNYLLREWRITGNTVQRLASIYGFRYKLNSDEKENLKNFFPRNDLDEIFKFKKLQSNMYCYIQNE